MVIGERIAHAKAAKDGKEDWLLEIGYWRLVIGDWELVIGERIAHAKVAKDGKEDWGSSKV